MKMAGPDFTLSSFPYGRIWFLKVSVDIQIRFRKLSGRFEDLTGQGVLRNTPIRRENAGRAEFLAFHAVFAGVFIF